ncbi:MAG: NINE protein [Bacteroidota bacterium]
MRKSKSAAGMMALIFGFLGIHRFYLGQIWHGIAYLVVLSIFASVSTWFFMLINLVDAVSLFSMDKDLFDEKYNGGRKETQRDEYESPTRKTARPDRRTARRDRRNERYQERNQPQAAPPRRPKVNVSGLLKSGKAKFKDYDYEGAIADFTKVLNSDSQNIPAHFNLACAYSLMENKEQSLYHLDRAVALGFDDFEAIKTRDHLAYLRIQPEFLTFKANGYRLAKDTQANSAPTNPTTATPTPGQGDLLEQLNQLAKLKEKGLLTEEEFRVQKEKLLR